MTFSPFLRFLLLLSWGLLLPSASGAQPTLEECLQRAEQHHPLRRNAELIRQTEQLTLSNIARGWLPQITASAEAALQSDVTQWPSDMEQMMRKAGATPPQGIGHERYQFGLSVEQPLYEGGSIHSRKATERAEAAVRSSQLRVQLYDIRRRVIDLFFGILLLDEQLENNRILCTLLHDNERKMQSLVRGGMSMASAVAALQAERLTAEQQATSLRARRRSLQHLLALFTGLTPEATERLARPAAPPPPNDEQHRPEFRLFADRDAALARREDELHAALRPRISLFAQGWYGYPGLNLFESMYSRGGSFNGLVGVKAVWNLSRFYTYRNDRQRLYTTRQENEVERSVFSFNQRLQATQEDQEIMRLRALIATDGDIVRLRTSVRETTTRQLEGGTADVYDLMQDLAREDQARAARSLHEIQLLQALHHLRNTYAHE